MKLNIQWIKVLYGIALMIIGIILAAMHFIVAGNGIGYMKKALKTVGLLDHSFDCAICKFVFIGYNEVSVQRILYRNFFYFTENCLPVK